MRRAQLLERCLLTWFGAGAPGWCGCVPVEEASWTASAGPAQRFEQWECDRCSQQVTWREPPTDLHVPAIGFRRAFRAFRDVPQQVRPDRAGDITMVVFDADGSHLVAVLVVSTSGPPHDGLWVPFDAWTRLVDVDDWAALWEVFAPDWPDDASVRQLVDMIVGVAAGE